MNAPTAGAILATIEQRNRAADIARVADLDGAERELAVEALSRVPRRSRIDVDRFVADVRQRAAERAAAEAAERRRSADPARYERLLVSQGYVPFRSPPPASVDRGAELSG